MESYRKRLKLQNTVCTIGIFVLIILNTVVRNYIPISGIIRPLSRSNFYDFYEGFIGGVSTGVGLLLVINILLNTRAMRDENRLKMQYVKENDERRKQIWLMSGANSYWFDVIGLLLAAIVAGRFSITAFLCLLGSLLYICIVRGIFKLYYSKKY